MRILFLRYVTGLLGFTDNGDGTGQLSLDSGPGHWLCRPCAECDAATQVVQNQCQDHLGTGAWDAIVGDAQGTGYQARSYVDRACADKPEKPFACPEAHTYVVVKDHSKSKFSI